MNKKDIRDCIHLLQAVKSGISDRNIDTWYKIYDHFVFLMRDKTEKKEKK